MYDSMQNVELLLIFSLTITNFYQLRLAAMQMWSDFFSSSVAVSYSSNALIQVFQLCATFPLNDRGPGGFRVAILTPCDIF